MSTFKEIMAVELLTLVLSLVSFELREPYGY